MSEKTCRNKGDVFHPELTLTPQSRFSWNLAVFLVESHKSNNLILSSLHTNLYLLVDVWMLSPMSMCCFGFIRRTTSPAAQSRQFKVKLACDQHCFCAWSCCPLNHQTHKLWHSSSGSFVALSLQDLFLWQFQFENVLIVKKTGFNNTFSSTEEGHSSWVMVVCLRGFCFLFL